jgi:thiol-disulfide isomerase/thioredoxin
MPVAIPAGNAIAGAPLVPAPTVSALPGLAAQAEEAVPPAPSEAAPGWLGVALSRAEGDPAGVLITRVLRGSPAAEQGLEAGDRVLSINDQPVNDPEDLSRRVAAFGRGGRVGFAVLRAGQHRLLAVQLGENPGFEGQLRMGFVGAPAPELEGARVAQGSLEPRLRSLSGRVVVLEFWATWCGACRALMPTLNGWHERYRAEGATVVSVTMDEVDKAASDAHQLGMEYAVLSDPEGNVVRSYQAFALPTLFVIDRAGVVRDVAVGYDETRLAELRRTIETLLGES